MTITSICTSFAGNFDGHGDAPERNRAHRSMRPAQSFNWSHRTPQSVKYSLRIVPATARVPYKQAKQQNKYLHCCPFLMAMTMSQCDTKHINHCSTSRASVEATGRRYQVSICDDEVLRSSQCCDLAWLLRCKVLGMTQFCREVATFT
jgi:hypothetical protein